MPNKNLPVFCKVSLIVSLTASRIQPWNPAARPERNSFFCMTKPLPYWRNVCKKRVGVEDG